MTDDTQPSGGCGRRPTYLPWTRFNWCAISKYSDENKMMLYGTTQLEHRVSDQTLRTRVLGIAASLSNEIGVPWDPFNVEVMIKPTEIQPGGGAL